MPEMKRTNEAIERAKRDREARLVRSSQFKKQLAATDRLLDLLERMNLADVDRLGVAAARGIARATEALPPSLRPVVRPTTTVQSALDQVFEVQRTLFSERARRTKRGPPQGLLLRRHDSGDRAGSVQASPAVAGTEAAPGEQPQETDQNRGADEGHDDLGEEADHDDPELACEPVAQQRTQDARDDVADQPEPVATH